MQSMPSALNPPPAKGRVLEPKPFYDTRNAKDLENFHWDMEQYFIASRIPAGEQVTITTMYLSGDAKLWWRIGSSDDATIGRPKIRTWETLKKDLKDQFLPTNTMWMARESVTPQNPRVPLITPQRMEYLWVSHASIPPYRIPFTGIHSCIYILEKYTNLSKQFIRV